MREAMGEAGAKSVAMGTFFGFISSSCSFAALATTRSLFAKGAGIVPSLAFLLASTNLVIELGIVIAVFLGWQFVVGEYIGGVLLIAVDYTLFSNLGFLAMSGAFAWLAWGHEGGHERGGGDGDPVEKVLFWLALASFVWLAGGWIVRLMMGSAMA